MGGLRRRLALFSGIGAVLAVTAAFLLWTARSPVQVQNLLVRAVVVTLVLFLLLLVARFLALLWFGYLHHVEQDVRGARAPNEWPPVSILVPAHNEGPVIEAAIRSLLALEYPVYEIIVIDDGSTDDTLEVAARLEGAYAGREVRVVTTPRGGKARALNTGLRLARYPFVLCMDADSRLDPRVLAMAIPHFDDPDVGAVAGNVKVANRTNTLTRLQALEYIEGLNLPRRAQGFLGAVSIVPGPVGVFRRAALEQVGGYDTDTFAEDADLTLKLVTAGWKVVYEDRAIAWTEAPESVLDLIQQRYRWTRGILQAVRKRRRWFLQPFPDVPMWLSLVQMAFEGFVWPALNVYGHAFFATVALTLGMGEMLLYWWVLLTLLDVTVALATIAMEGEDLRLVPYALIYRFFFILFIDVVKLLASAEEVLGVRMGWGKVARVGTAPAGGPP